MASGGHDHGPPASGSIVFQAAERAAGERGRQVSTKLVSVRGNGPKKTFTDLSMTPVISKWLTRSMDSDLRMGQWRTEGRERTDKSERSVESDKIDLTVLALRA